MTYSKWTRLLLTSVLIEVDDELRRTMNPLLRQIVRAVIIFLRNDASPTSSLRFEECLDQALRNLGRVVTEWTYIGNIGGGICRSAHEGAGIVLTLRVILLSGIWEEVYGAALESHTTPSVQTYEVPHAHTLTIAA